MILHKLVHMYVKFHIITLIIGKFVATPNEKLYSMYIYSVVFKLPA